MCDAPKSWFIRLKDEVKKLGLTPCDLDPALSYWYKNGKLEGIMCVHVDDILWGGSENFIKEVIVELESMLTIGSLEKINIKYLGLNVNQDKKKNISIDQDKYIEHFQVLFWYAISIVV